MNCLYRISKLVILGALLIQAPLAAFAGQQEGGNAGGGGKGIVCRDERFVETLYLADTMDYVRSGGLAQFSRATEDESVIKAIAELIEKQNPQKIYPNPMNPSQKVSLAWLIEYNEQRLGWGIDFQLRDIPDDNIDPQTLPTGCQKVQVAYTDLTTGTLNTNSHFEHKLTWIQRGFLKLHEALIAVRGTPGADTTPIRLEVERYAKLLDQNINQVSPMLRSMLLKGRKPGRNAHEEATLEFADVNECYNVVHNYLRSEDELKTKCGLALVDQEEFRNRPYPKLRIMPTQLQCKTTAVSKSAANVQAQPMFTFKMSDITMMGTYSLEMGGQTRVATGTSQLWVESRAGYQLTNSFKRFSFDMVFPGQVRASIDGYNERTALFDGTLQFGDASSWVSYKIVCDGGAAVIGL